MPYRLATPHYLLRFKIISWVKENCKCFLKKFKKTENEGKSIGLKGSIKNDCRTRNEITGTGVILCGKGNARKGVGRSFFAFKKKMPQAYACGDMERKDKKKNFGGFLNSRNFWFLSDSFLAVFNRNPNLPLIIRRLRISSGEDFKMRHRCITLILALGKPFG